MSSWSSTHGAPARSERSRSPPRGAYGRPPYPDPYTDSHRDHWDSYNRDRAWADYERDRGYDYGRRGRSRSPQPDDCALQYPFYVESRRRLIFIMQRVASGDAPRLHMSVTDTTLDLDMRTTVSAVFRLVP